MYSEVSVSFQTFSPRRTCSVLFLWDTHIDLPVGVYYANCVLGELSLSLSCLLACLGYEGRNPLARTPTPSGSRQSVGVAPSRVGNTPVPPYVPVPPVPEEHPS